MLEQILKKVDNVSKLEYHIQSDCLKKCIDFSLNINGMIESHDV